MTKSFRLLERLVELGLTVHPEKCEFRKTELEFFGLKFSAKGVSLTDAKMKAVEEAKEANTVSELRSFLGLVVYCSRHIPKLESLAAPLWNLLRSSKPQTKLIWLDEHTEALNAFKAGICKKALGYFNKGWKTLLEVDASPFGVGAVLSQESLDGKDIQVVAFWSQLLSDIERMYSQVEREALAVVLAFERFRFYVIDCCFTLITDCKAVELILRNPNAKPPLRFARFLLRLMD